MHSFSNYLALIIILCSPVSAKAQEKQGRMSLDDAFRYVYHNSPTLKAAREELKETQELMPQARAGWLPSITAETGITSSDVESSNFGAGTGATTKDLTFSIDQPIYRGGRTFAQADQAKSAIDAGRYLLKQREQELLFRTASVYVNVVRDMAVLDLRTDNESLLRAELEIARERFDLGEATITSVQQAKVRYQRAKSNTINAEAKLQASIAVFTEVVGRPPKNLFMPQLKIKLPENVKDMIYLAEERNPEIWIAKHEFQAAKHGAKAVLREMFPQISAFATYNKQYDPQPGIVEQTKTETIGIRATLALYQGGATRSRLRETQRTAKKMEYRIEEIKRKIEQEIISDWRTYQSAKEETQSRILEIEMAKQALYGVREEARLGQRTTLDVLDADEELIDAKISMEFAKANEIVRHYSLASNLGLLSVVGIDHQYKTTNEY